MSSPLEMLFVLGLPGAGKSTYVASLPAIESTANTIICFDMLRKALGHIYHHSTEPQVNAYACVMARLALMSGKNAVIDESITTPGIAIDLTRIGREFNATIQMHYLTTAPEVCRASRVPEFMSAAEFGRKLGEWQLWSKHILHLADTVKVVDPLTTQGDTPLGSFELPRWRSYD